MNVALVRDEYGRIASTYDRRWQSYVDATLSLAIEAMTWPGTRAVLDVACGTGALERRLSRLQPTCHLVGVDASRAMLDQARRQGESDCATWIEADARSLPFADQTFDCVVCANSVHYFATPIDAIAEMRRMLRPGGQLIVVDWCDDYFTCKACGVWLRWTRRALHQIYSLRDCSALVEQAGFRIKNASRFRVNWIWGVMRIVGRRNG